MGPDELTAFRLKAIERGITELKAQNADQSKVLADIRTDQALSRQEFARHEEDIADLKATKNRATTGLVTGLIGIIGWAASFIPWKH